MADFGAIEIDFNAGISKCRKHPVLFYRSRIHTGHVFKLHYSHSRNNKKYYRCQNCNSINAGYKPCITVEDGRYLTDPDRPKKRHLCTDQAHCSKFTEGSHLGQQVMRETSQHLREKNGIAVQPRQAFREVKRKLQELPEEVRSDAQHVVGHYKSQRSTLCRAVQFGCPQINKVTEIPPKLTVSWGERRRLENAEISELEINPEELYIAYNNMNDDAPMVLLQTKQMAKHAHNATDLVLDGTFTYVPAIFAQCYIVVSVTTSDDFHRREQHIVAIALLNDKEGATYVEFLTQMRNHVISVCGDTGNLTTCNWHIDFEAGAYAAVSAVFGPGVHLYGCVFHYPNCLVKNMHSRKLLPLYMSDPLFQNWVRRLMAIGTLPPGEIMHHADRLLRNPPAHPPEHERQINDFIRYYRHWWMAPERLVMLNMFDLTTGPRTTNAAESQHAQYAQRFHGSKAMKLGVFLHHSQLCHNDVRTELTELMEWRPPKLRRKGVIACDLRIQRAKERYAAGDYIGRVDDYLLHQACNLGRLPQAPENLHTAPQLIVVDDDDLPDAAVAMASQPTAPATNPIEITQPGMAIALQQMQQQMQQMQELLRVHQINVPAPTEQHDLSSAIGDAIRLEI